MSPELQQEQNAIDIERGKLEARQRELNARKNLWLEDQHEELKAQCRAAKDEFDRLEREKEAAKRAWIQADGERQNAKNHLDNHYLIGQRGSWPSREELATRDTRRAELQASYQAALNAVSAARREYDALIAACKIAREKLDVKADEEWRFRSQLRGPSRRGVSVTADYSSGNGVTVAAG
jgi:hypothetical protein